MHVREIVGNEQAEMPIQLRSGELAVAAGCRFERAHLCVQLLERAAVIPVVVTRCRRRPRPARLHRRMHELLFLVEVRAAEQEQGADPCDQSADFGFVVRIDAPGGDERFAEGHAQGLVRDEVDVVARNRGGDRNASPRLFV